MQKLLWIGEPYFAGALPDCGWAETAILKPGHPAASWEDLVKKAGFAPDVTVVAAENDSPPLMGIENLPCLTVFYSANFRDWHLAYAQAFDAAIISSFDQIPNFYMGRLQPENIWWSPPFASDDAQPASNIAQVWDCLYIPNADYSDNNGNFADKIAAGLTDFHIRAGNNAEHMPKARILLLHSEKNELDASIFDALGRGCCLVTPRVKDGLGKIFVDGEQLVAYTPGDAGDALYRINFLLERPELRKHIAASGNEEINAFHRAIHRAQSLTDHLCDLYMAGMEGIVGARLGESDSIRQDYLEEMYRQLAEKSGLSQDSGDKG